MKMHDMKLKTLNARISKEIYRQWEQKAISNLMDIVPELNIDTYSGESVGFAVGEIAEHKLKDVALFFFGSDWTFSVDALDEIIIISNNNEYCPECGKYMIYCVNNVMHEATDLQPAEGEIEYTCECGNVWSYDY